MPNAGTDLPSTHGHSPQSADESEAPASEAVQKCDQSTQTIASGDDKASSDTCAPVMSYRAFVRAGEKIEAIPRDEMEHVVREIKQMDSIIEVRRSATV